MKRGVTNWEKIFASHRSDRGLVSRICKEPSKLYNKKITQLEMWENITRMKYCYLWQDGWT